MGSVSVWARILAWLARMFGPSVKTRLLDTLESQIRLAVKERSEAGLERERFLAAMTDIQASHERLHAATAQMVKELSSAVLQSGEAFNKYLDLIRPSGEPQVRFMTDAREAALEAKLRGEHLGEELAPVPAKDHLVDQLATADDLTNALRAFVSDL